MCSACSATADPETIKAAYRKLAKEHHPDRHNGCSEHEAQFKAISEAYDCLKDPQKRAAYDRFGKAAFQNGGGGDPFGGGGGFESFSDIFSSIFGEFADRAGRAPEPGARRGPSLRPRTDAWRKRSPAPKPNITIEALAQCENCDGRGCTNTDDCARTCGTCGGAGKVRAQQGFFVVERGCPTCRGSGEVIADPCHACEGEGRALKRRKLSVKIPAGVDEGTRIRVAGEGEAGVRNAPERRPLHLRPHEAAPDLLARGHDPDRRMPGHLHDGGARRLDQPARHRRQARSSSRSRPASSRASSFASAASGMSVLNGRGRGDLVARVLVETPTRLNSKQKKILEEFRETETGDECPASKSFFSRIRDMLGG